MLGLGCPRRVKIGGYNLIRGGGGIGSFPASASGGRYSEQGKGAAVEKCSRSKRKHFSGTARVTRSAAAMISPRLGFSRRVKFIGKTKYAEVAELVVSLRARPVDDTASKGKAQRSKNVRAPSESIFRVPQESRGARLP